MILPISPPFSPAPTWRVLAVDDNPHCTRLTRLALEKTGSYQVRELNHPEAAVAVARDFAPHLVLMDVDMPRLDGRAAALLIQSEEALQDVPILFMTSMIPESESAGANPFGWFGPVAKPISARQLCQAVASILEHGTLEFRSI